MTALFEDREGNLWAGTSQGIERLRERVFVTYSASEGIPTENNGPVYVDGDNRVWFGPAAGGLYWLKGGRVERVRSAGLHDDVIYSITGDKTGLWIGRQKGGLTRLVHKDGSYKTEDIHRDTRARSKQRVRGQSKSRRLCVGRNSERWSQSLQRWQV